MMLPVGFWIVGTVQMYLGVVPRRFRSARIAASASILMPSSSSGAPTILTPSRRSLVK